MQISTKDWKNYIEKLSKLNNTAGEKMSDYVARHGFDDPKIIDYAYGLVTKYGEGSASLSAMMYDAIAEMEGKILPPAEVANTPGYGEVAKAVNGVRKHSQNPTSYGNVVNRLVKRTGADTMLKNAERDGAEFAWIPSGDTCAFCIALASRGWQHISKKALKNGHAEHIHANCDCNYTVRFDGRSSVAGYDPDEYLEIYENAEGNTPDEKINSIRAKYRAENKDKINAQKRANYSLNKYFAAQTEGDVKIPSNMVDNFSDFAKLDLNVTEKNILKELNNKSIENQFEYGKIIYKEGETDILTSKLHDRVELPIEETEGTDLFVLHSHTNETPLSSVDFYPLVLEKVNRIGVISENGDVWIADVSDGYRPSLDEIKSKINQIIDEVTFDIQEDPSFWDWSTEERNYMFIREKMYRIAQEYKWKLMGGKIDE